MHICVDDFFVRVTDSTNIWQTSLLSYFGIHMHSIFHFQQDIEGNIPENWREQSYVLDYAHTIADSFFAARKTIIPDKASVDT